MSFDLALVLLFGEIIPTAAPQVPMSVADQLAESDAVVVGDVAEQSTCWLPIAEVECVKLTNVAVISGALASDDDQIWVLTGSNVASGGADCCAIGARLLAIVRHNKEFYSPVNGPHSLMVVTLVPFGRRQPWR